MHCRLGAPRHDQTVFRSARESVDATLDLTPLAHADPGELRAQRRSHRLNGREEAGSVGSASFPKDRNALHPGRDLLEQLEPFRADAELEQGKSSDVAAWPPQALDKAGADRITD